MITGTVPVKVPEKLSELELDAGGKRIENLGLGDTLDDVMRRSEKTGDYGVYGLLAAGLAANRPAPGIVDRFYFSTDTLVLERDTGVAWVEVARGETAIRLAQLAERAHNSLTGVTPDQHHAKYTDAEAAAQAAALIAIHAALAAAHHTKTTAAAEITSGTFPVVRGGTGLSTIALGGILYASALDVLSRLAPTAANQVLRSTAANALQFAALIAADIPNLASSKITSGQFPLARMPRAASGLFLEGNGVGGDPIFNALVVGDIPSLDASKIGSGTFGVARGGTGLATIAAGGILYASVLDILVRIAPTAANQVLRSTAANALQFAALLAADIPSLDAAKITSGQFPLGRMPRAASGLFLEGNGAGANPIFNALVAGDIPNLDAAKITSGVFVLARIPNMDWAHISGLFPRTIADLLSDHNLAHHPLAIIPTMDLAHIPSGIQGKLTAACAYKYSHPTARQCTTGSWAWGSISGKPTSPSLEEMATEHQSDGTHGAITPTSCTQKYTHPTTGTCPQAPKALKIGLAPAPLISLQAGSSAMAILLPLTY